MQLPMPRVQTGDKLRQTTGNIYTEGLTATRSMNGLGGWWGNIQTETLDVHWTC
jgi:hypothetical protein